MFIDEIPANAKPIPDHLGYFVTPDGYVFSNRWGKPRMLEPGVTRGGYLFVHPCKKCVHTNLYVHRLVAEAFIPNPDGKPEVNHKDGNKHNNAVSNLEWVTPSENQKHAYRTGLNKPPHCKKVVAFDTLTGDIKEFSSLSSCARHLGCTYQNVVYAIEREYLCKGRYKVKYAQSENEEIMEV